MKTYIHIINCLVILVFSLFIPATYAEAQFIPAGTVRPATLEVNNLSQGTGWTRNNVTINPGNWVQLRVLPQLGYPISSFYGGGLTMSACWIQNVNASYFTGSLQPRGGLTGTTVNVPNPAPGTSATYIGRCSYNCIGGSQQNCKISQGGPNVNLGWVSQLITITTQLPPPPPPPPPPACSDTQDNDGDGLIDYGAGATNDPGCSSAIDNDEFNSTTTTPTTPTTTTALPACSDTQDNDGDGLIDYGTGTNNDPGCTSATDTDETNTPVTQCSDGLDNDGDGSIDFPNDTNCTNSGDTTEAAPPTITANGRSSGIIVRSGTSVAVAWQTNGGTNCSLSSNIPDNNANPNDNGSNIVTVRNQSTFTITCNGQSDSVTVQVLPIIYE